ncbi:MAG: tetratricopeptide repeat protein [Pseudomonadales bacterium]|nr:tetratricopeptide repeat protein [Pseudomonadales bacterium]
MYGTASSDDASSGSKIHQPEKAIEPENSSTKNIRSHPEDKRDGDEDGFGESSFSPETLYSLLVGEIAGHRGRLDVALNQYIKQAEVTRDPKVVARANRIARYMRAPKPTLDTALLWVEVEPNAIEAKQVAAQQLIIFGRYDEALEQIDTLLKLSADINLDGLIQSASRLDPQALGTLIISVSKLSQKHAKNAKLMLAHGLLLEINKRDSDALKIFKCIHKIQADYTPAYIAQARLLTKMGKRKSAKTLLAKAVKKHKQNIRLRLFYAQELIHDKELNKAEKQLSAAQALSPSDSKLLFTLGMIYLENDLTEQARPYFERLINIAQNTDNAHFYLAVIDEKAGRLEPALEHLRKVKPSKTFVNARIQIANILDQQNKSAEAAEAMASDREKFPQFSSIFFLAQSELLAQRERYEESYQLLEQALLVHKDHPQLLYSKAMIAEKMNKLDIMEKDLLRIIDSNPQNASALNALGYSLANRGERLDEALTYITRAYALAPDDPAIIDSMGWVLYRLNDLEKAVAHLRAAYKKMPDQEIAAHFGEVLWASGQKEEAKSVWQESLKKNPESEILKVVIKRFLP